MALKQSASRKSIPTIQVVDFFCGCGGMSYGFATAKTKNVRFTVKGALDIDEHATATYRRMLGIEPLTKDVSELLDPTHMEAAVRHWDLNKNHPLLLIGCAPCQGFSSHRKKDPRKDERNSLLEVFAQIVVRLKPEMVVMENVPEMLNERHWRHFEAWRNEIGKAGYSVRARIYSLAQFGVPQERFRAVVVADRTRGWFEMPQPTHSPRDFMTVRSAIGGLPSLKAGGADPNDPMHMTSRHRKETVELLKLIPKDGGSRRSLPKGVGPDCLTKVDGFRDVYGRLAWDKPAVAITARCRTPSCGRFSHPVQDRGLSVREAALLQGFPPEYYFEGPFDDKFKQIGNAVSPAFAEALALHIDRTYSDRATKPLVQDESDITRPIRKSFSSAIASIKRRMRLSDSQLLLPL